MGDELLTVANISAGYLGKDVVHDATITVSEGEAVAVIGSNGAGKSTLFKAVCGLLGSSAGSVRFDGKDITAKGAHQIARDGLVYVPAERHLFDAMSVRDNLILGAYPKRHRDSQLDFVYGLLRQRIGGCLPAGHSRLSFRS